MEEPLAGKTPAGFEQLRLDLRTLHDISKSNKLQYILEAV